MQFFSFSENIKISIKSCDLPHCQVFAEDTCFLSRYDILQSDIQDRIYHTAWMWHQCIHNRIPITGNNVSHTECYIWNKEFSEHMHRLSWRRQSLRWPHLWAAEKIKPKHCDFVSLDSTETPQLYFACVLKPASQLHHACMTLTSTTQPADEDASNLPITPSNNIETKFVSEGNSFEEINN